jgi:hypothetical protein
MIPCNSFPEIDARQHVGHIFTATYIKPQSNSRDASLKCENISVEPFAFHVTLTKMTEDGSPCVFYRPEVENTNLDELRYVKFTRAPPFHSYLITNDVKRPQREQHRIISKRKHLRTTAPTRTTSKSGTRSAQEQAFGSRDTAVGVSIGYGLDYRGSEFESQ